MTLVIITYVKFVCYVRLWIFILNLCMFVDYTGLSGRVARGPMGYFLSKIKIHSFIQYNPTALPPNWIRSRVQESLRLSCLQWTSSSPKLVSRGARGRLHAPTSLGQRLDTLTDLHGTPCHVRLARSTSLVTSPRAPPGVSPRKRVGSGDETVLEEVGT